MENNETLGSYLRQQREQRSISLEQVSYATRISVKMLRALEENRHEELPASAFVRGYLQAYARYVDLDVNDLLLRYQHHLATEPGAKRTTLRSHYLYVKERYQEKRRLILVVSLFSMLLVSAGAYFMLKEKRERRKHSNTEVTAAIAPAPKPDEKIDVKVETKTEVKAEAAKAPAPSPAPVAAPVTEKKAETTAATSDNTPKTYNLKLTATEDAWMRFQSDNESVREIMLRKDKTIYLRANKVIKMFSGNLGAIKASLNGEELKTLITPDRNMSVVLPTSEIPNYPLPLFPQDAKEAEKKP